MAATRSYTREQTRQDRIAARLCLLGERVLRTSAPNSPAPPPCRPRPSSPIRRGALRRSPRTGFRRGLSSRARGSTRDALAALTGGYWNRAGARVPQAPALADGAGGTAAQALAQQRRRVGREGRGRHGVYAVVEQLLSAQKPLTSRNATCVVKGRSRDSYPCVRRRRAASSARASSISSMTASRSTAFTLRSKRPVSATPGCRAPSS